MVRPRVRGKPEKEETNSNKDANDVLGSVKKPRSDMSQIWPNTIEENQNKKSKKDVRRTHPITGSEKHLKNSERPRILVSSRNSSGNFSGQQP